MPTTPILLVHGGAWAIPDALREAHLRGVRAALDAGYALLTQGASALDAIEAAVATLEDDETFDAGRGAFLTRDGRVQLDALLMDGATLRAGGVACVERLRNPVRAARLVLDQSPHVYFVGQGAEAFAEAHGMELIDNSELVVDRERAHLAEAQRKEQAGLPDLTFAGAEGTPGPSSSLARPREHVHSSSHPGASGIAPFPAEKGAHDESCSDHSTFENALDSHDTVGAVALDIHGNLAAATSTGGTLNKAPGRVGDSSLIGCGCYADNLSAATSLTGWGEPIMKLVLGKWAVDRVASGVAPNEAAQAAIDYLHSRLGGHGGIILLGPDGRFGIAHNTPGMAWGVADAGGVRAGLEF
jgi:beta-aspartyl-peptidase (threonine type)